MLEEVIVIPFPGRLGKIWMIWNVRVVILYSLLFQIILFFGAPMRKRTGNRWVLLLIWSSYFFAEWATNFALGQITSSQNSKHGENRDLYAFWASFLLLHHGGPDTKTAFEENENELWLRHLLTLISQAGPMSLIFVQTLPESQLWFPTSLILLAGIIKYAEWACSLYSASWRTFQETMLKEPDPGPDYAKLMQKFSSMKVARLPTIMSQTFYSTSQPDSTSQPRQDQELDEFDVVKYAYEHFFKIFKGLVVDLVSQHDRQESRAFFLARRPEDALKVLEVEFNFIYEFLYTKFNVIHNLKGYFWRSVSSLLVLVSLGIFFFVDCKNGLGKFDIGVTYTLLLGALSLEAMALFKLIFSDRTAASLDKTKANRFVQTIFERYLKFKSPRWSQCKDKSSMNPNTRQSPCSMAGSGIDQSRTTSVLLRRWSESVAGFNLITYCLKQLPKNSHGENQWCLGIYKKTSHLLHRIQRTCRKNVGEPLGAQDFLDELNYASKNRFTENLWNFIFCELRQKSEEKNKLENIKTRSSARGAYVLEKYKNNLGGVFETLKTDYIENVTFDESLLLWHIATELCYHGSEVDHETKAQVPDEQELCYNGSEVDHDTEAQVPDEQELCYNGSEVDHDTEAQVPDEQELDYRKFSKLISDYMLYLLVMKPTMMSAVAGIGQIRYRDTCADAQRFFLNEKLGPNTENLDACKKLLDVNTDVKPVHVKGDKSKSVLFDACMLAKELQKLEIRSKWEVISKVWVEMLAYASNHCKPDAHIEQVSRGGELINLVWLLMAHLGLADQFVFTTGPAKLIVEK